jgi:MFS family permease
VSSEPQDSLETPVATEDQLQHEMPGGRLAGGHDPYIALRTRNFRTLILSSLIKGSSQKIQGAALGWEIYHHTGSAMALGWLGLATALPTLCLSLFAGHIADRFNRKWVVVVAWATSGLASLVLTFLSLYCTAWHGWVLAVYAAVFFNGVVMTFARPARQSLMPRLVPPEHFTNAVTWNSSIGEISAMLGPAIGGMIIAINIPLAYLMTAIGTAVAAVQLSRIDNDTASGAFEKSAPKPRDTITPWQSLTAGVRFVWNTKLLLSVMAMDMFAVLLGGSTYLLPIFAKRLGVGAVGFGWLRAAPAIGAFSMAIFLAHGKPMKRAGRTLLLSVTGFGAATIVFGLSHSYLLSWSMLLITGMLDNVSVVIRQSLIQLLPPDHMRGRVSAVNMIFVGSSDELGGMESGLTAAAFGPVASVVGGGIGCILVVIGAAAIWPQLRRLGPLRDVDDEPPNETAPPRVAVLSA